MAVSKLQIRARLLSSITELMNPANRSAQSAMEVIDSLRDIEDREAILEILAKELKKENPEERCQIIFCLLHELADKNQTETALLAELANPALSDKIKSQIINVLRAFGNHLNYDDYLQYLQNPEEIIDADTTRLLASAILNPEAQIDFLDFINALPLREGKMLLDSLNNDYDGDNLANILAPLIIAKPCSKLAFDAIKNIGESKSELALRTLNYVLENVNDLKVKAHAQKSINMLKLSGIKEDNTDEFYAKILAKSPVYKCFTNLPDGHGNIGVIFSRKNDEELIQMFSVVINDIDGIVDCFGFNEISDSEFGRITSKFFANDEIIEISPEFCKFLLINAEKTSRLMFDEMPYEYAAWRTITFDIPYKEFDLTQNARKIRLNDFLLRQLYEKGYFEKWFFDKNELFSAFLEKFNENPEEYFKNPLPADEIFTPELKKTIDHRLKLMSYLLRVEGHDIEADMLFTLSQNTEYLTKFYENIIKKSIYEHFLNKKEQFYSQSAAASIFTRKREEERKKIDINFVESILKKIEENWVEHE